MRKSPYIILIAILGGLTIVSSVAGRQDGETITIEEILDGIKESAMSFNRSLQNLTVKQTITCKATFIGEAKVVKEIRFRRPDIIEQRIMEREEKVRNGSNIKIERPVTYTLFMKSPLSSLSLDDCDVDLIGKKTVRGRPTYLLWVKPKDERGDFINGKIWIDAKDFTLVRLESKPIKKEDRSKVKNAKQIIEYDKIGDKYWLPILDRIEGSGWIFVKIVSEVMYSHYEINSGGDE
ncbi:MAG: hypothetical protein KAV99_03480 [Candidatus Latescibacteria bacterium]|nr:hypothetical protein [Candidatus Latescibacterota bacterium]